MKKIIIVLSFVAMLAGCSDNKQQQPAVVLPQATEADIVAVTGRLTAAMIAVDESTLKSILAEELVYGHSGGKVQNKSEFIAEILSGEPLKYVSIELLDQTIQMAGNAAVVRHIFTAETMNADGTQGNLRVGNVFVWLLQNGEWKLLVRQAYRL